MEKPEICSPQILNPGTPIYINLNKSITYLILFFDPISEMRMTIVYFFIMIIEGNTFAFQDSNLFYLSKYELV